MLPAAAIVVIGILTCSCLGSSLPATPEASKGEEDKELPPPPPARLGRGEVAAVELGDTSDWSSEEAELLNDPAAPSSANCLSKESTSQDVANVVLLLLLVPLDPALLPALTTGPGRAPGLTYGMPWATAREAQAARPAFLPKLPVQNGSESTLFAPQQGLTLDRALAIFLLIGVFASCSREESAEARPPARLTERGCK